jgi:hypothetical protein
LCREIKKKSGRKYLPTIARKSWAVEITHIAEQAETFFSLEDSSV